MKQHGWLTFEVALFLIAVVMWAISSLVDRQPSGASTPGTTEAPAQAGAAVPPAPEEMKPYLESIPGTDVKFEMVPIPGGTFTMGSPPTEAGHKPDEGPQHQVTLRPFWMEKFETRWDEYDVFAFAQDLLKKRQQNVNLTAQTVSEKAADAVTRPTPPYEDETFGFGREGHPAIDITHHAAMEYTRWLSAKTGKEYRLPTEAEWEYACRAGTQTPYYFGGDPKQLSDYAWYLDNSDARPREVGKKRSNPWGLYDMLGNVAEWVLDEYAKDAYRQMKPSAALLSPVVLPTEKKYPDVVRGGSWDDEPQNVRCAARQASDPDWSQQDPQRPQSIWWHTDATFVGFRVVRPLEEQENLKGLRSKVKKYD
jgi:formylglycine-generating enzyme required for sulfatase activity